MGQPRKWQENIAPPLAYMVGSTTVPFAIQMAVPNELKLRPEVSY